MNGTAKRLPRFRQVKNALPLRLTARDKMILEWLSRFSVMNSEQACRVVTGSPQGIRRRLQRLFHHGFVRRHRPAGDQNQALVYALSPKGARTINGRAVRSSKGSSQLHLKHELMVSEIGVRLTEFLKGRGEVLFDRAAFPLNRNAPKAFHTILHICGRLTRVSVVPDLIAKVSIEGTAFSLLIEADRGTMPVKRGSLQQSSIHRKLIAYRRLNDSGKMRRQLHSKRVLVVFVCESTERETNIRAHASASFKGFDVCFVLALSHFPEAIIDRYAADASPAYKRPSQ